MELQIGKYKEEKGGHVFEYWVNEIFKTTAHVDCLTYRKGNKENNCYHTFDRRYPIWLIEQQIQNCQKIE